MVVCIAILIVGVLFYVFVIMKKKVIPNPPGPTPPPVPPEPGPLDPTFYKWQFVDAVVKATEMWAKYIEGVKNITTDTLLALELRRKVKDPETGKLVYFYVWTAEEGDYWDFPHEVYATGKVDCDGFARFVVDVIGRVIMLALKLITDVWWMEYYGYYRVYTYDPETGEYSYKVKLGGHAIAAYMKNGELLAFSNTQWWHDKGFQDFLDVGEETFPEGLIRVVCRHWETGKAQWIQTSKEGEILEGTNVFNRKISKLKGIRHLDKWSVI